MHRANRAATSSCDQQVCRVINTRGEGGRSGQLAAAAIVCIELRQPDYKVSLADAQLRDTSNHGEELTAEMSGVLSSGPACPIRVQFGGDQSIDAPVLLRDEMLRAEEVNVAALSAACPWITRLHGFTFLISSQVN